MSRGTQSQPTETERIVMDIWREVFKIETVSPTNDLLDLGVDSLSVVDMCFRIEKLFGVEITPNKLLLMPTVAELSEYIDKHRDPMSGRSVSG